MLWTTCLQQSRSRLVSQSDQFDQPISKCMIGPMLCYVRSIAKLVQVPWYWPPSDVMLSSVWYSRYLRSPGPLCQLRRDVNVFRTLYTALFAESVELDATHKVQLEGSTRSQYYQGTWGTCKLFVQRVQKSAIVVATNPVPLIGT